MISIVLVIEDDPVVQELIKSELESSGIKVVQVYSLSEVREQLLLIKDRVYTAVLWDGAIPEKADEPNNLVLATPLLRIALAMKSQTCMITISSNEEIQIQHMKMGCDARFEKYLTSPDASEDALPTGLIVNDALAKDVLAYLQKL